MREILFKGIDIKTGKIVFGNYIEKINPTVKEPAFWCCFIQDRALSMYEVDPKTIGQFTGLTDKNGVMIFEGDKLQMYKHSDITHKHEKGTVWNDERKNDIRIVKFENGTFYTEGLCGIKIAFMHMARPGESFEVIGNIYDK